MFTEHDGERPRRSGHCRRRTRAVMMGVGGCHRGSLFVGEKLVAFFVWWKLVALFLYGEVSEEGYVLEVF